MLSVIVFGIGVVMSGPDLIRRCDHVGAIHSGNRRRCYSVYDADAILSMILHVHRLDSTSGKECGSKASRNAQDLLFGFMRR